MSARVSPPELELLESWQRGFPLVPRPFAVLGETLGLDEGAVCARIADLLARDIVVRVGAVVRPNTVGASTLAAMAVPAEQFEAVARRTSAAPAVTHNYEREHRLNLWFVVTAADRAGVAETLARIAADTGLNVLDLPLERAYHIDLGFPLGDPGGAPRAPAAGRASVVPDETDRALLAALEDGLPLDSHPYLTVAHRLGLGEGDVLARLERLLHGGVISRFGFVLKHRNLGYRANAMAVWDVPDSTVDRVGETMAARPFVTLCYRRPRRRPDWPYNLFCMVHGRDRETVLGQLAALNETAGAADLPRAVLFSRRCFKQRGARFAPARREAVA